MRAERDNGALGRVELLARGFSEALEGGEEGLDQGWGAGVEKGGGVVSILHCWDAFAPDHDAQIRVGLEPARESPAHKEVHGRR